jgi:EAL domain-containing protein (putative c-di-GMP-specific phosphodiesterase class I)
MTPQTRPRQLEGELGEALARNEFALHFQPHVDIKSKRVAGAEAQVRWNHPGRGFLQTGNRISFARQRSLIAGLESWVLQESIAAAATLREIDPAFRLYFKLSSLQHSDSRFLKQIVDAANLRAPLDNLGIELSPTAAMRDMQGTLRTVSVSREHGINVAIDARGVSSSALLACTVLRPDLVKIDSSISYAAPQNRYDAAIVEAIASIGHTIDYLTLVDGVEDREQLERFAESGCRYAQGRLLCPPLPWDVFLVWLCARSINCY